MGKKTPPFKNNPKWTEARFFSFIRSSLRSAFRKWGPKYEVLNDAKRPAEYEWWNAEGNRQLNVQWEYKCAGCGEWFMRKEVEVDHIEPVGSLQDFDDLPGFTERMFTSKDGLRVLCYQCHRDVTNEARKSK